MKRRPHWKRIVLVAALLTSLALAVLTLVAPLALRAYYRVDHLDLILEASRRRQVSPYLVGAVIFTESRFRKEARSEVGAIGLMQLMPDTAEEVAGRIGMKGYDPSSLAQPSVNIELGVAYLKYLKQRFPDESMMLAAYNAGPTLAAVWEAGDRSIPYPETREFVASVRRHQERLSWLYPEWTASERP